MSEPNETISLSRRAHCDTRAIPVGGRSVCEWFVSFRLTNTHGRTSRRTRAISNSASCFFIPCGFPLLSLLSLPRQSRTSIVRAKNDDARFTIGSLFRVEQASARTGSLCDIDLFFFFKTVTFLVFDNETLIVANRYGSDSFRSKKL